MDDQGRGELGDFVPREESAGTTDSNAGRQVNSICYGLLKEGGVRGKGRDGDTVY